MQEIGEFRTFASESVNPSTARPYTSTSALVERYLSQQTPSTGEAIIGVSGAEVLFTDNSRADAGEFLAKDRDRLDRILNDPSASEVTSREHSELRWGKVTVQPTGRGMPPGTVVVLWCTKPLHGLHPAVVALLGGASEGTAVVEMAAAAGLRLVPGGNAIPVPPPPTASDS